MSKPKFKNIVVAGDVGTGTTTLAKGLAGRLGWKYLSAGDIFREYHKKHNIPLWNKMALPDELERKVDNEFTKKLKTDKHTVFDGHYIGWFSQNMDDVYRILLTCAKKEATKRILEREHTHKETPEEIEKRRRQIREKFKKLYSETDYENTNLFHLVLDTTNSTTKETVDKSINNFKKAQN